MDLELGSQECRKGRHRARRDFSLQADAAVTGGRFGEPSLVSTTRGASPVGASAESRRTIRWPLRLGRIPEASASVWGIVSND